MPDMFEEGIELLGIHKNENQFYLHINLVLDQEIELFWKIDEAMAIELKEITNFEKKYKYRLSNYTFWNLAQKQDRSYLIKTFHEYNERLYFTCTEAYVQEIDQLKHIQSITGIHTLPFLSTQLPDEQKVEGKGKDKAKRTTWHFKPYQKLSLITAIVISVISLSFFGYTSPADNKKEQVKAEEANSKVILTSAKIPPKKELIKKEQPAIPVAKLKSTVNYTIPKGKVALTFDDGPSEYSKKMVDVLKSHKVGGTFFYIGANVKKHPEYVKYASSNGFSIGSHSMSHTKYTKLPIKKQEQEILQSNQLIKKITGAPVVLTRPPYGARNNSTVSLARKYNLDIVLWNIDTLDWKSRNSKKIIQAVKKENTSGSIILLHESKATLAALPDIINYLKKQDLEIVSLE